ncbi:MAG: SurA N-terminal domain-containing protein [Paracoccaceae bacterium]
MAKENSLSKTFIWILMGLLILGLGGFGATGLTGTLRTVGWVGDQPITVDEYFRELQREMNAFQAQTGQPLTMEQAQLFGIDQLVLGRLVALAALDEEVANIGVSVGDETVARELVVIPAFQGIDGSFDREAYRFSLEQAGLSESQFEDDLRAESARTLVQGAVVAAADMPSTFTDTLIAYVGERRSFTWAGLTSADLAEPLPAPTEAELQAYFEENGDSFRLPETKKITYAILTPEMLIDEVEMDDAALRALYDERAETYKVPERRLVERLVFSDEAEAQDAKAQIEVGGTTFEVLVADRGLTLTDIDLGDVTVEDLGDASEAVFAAGTGDVVGPLPTSLGPALFRVNGSLAARTTSYEDALPELRDELASDRARRLIDAQSQSFDDLLAGGATLEELADETEAELGQIEWTATTTEGVAAYDSFRRAAATVTADDFPEIAFLEDGGLFALRLDETLPERPEPFDSARDAVVADWTESATRSALEEQAAAAIEQLDGETGDFNTAGLNARVENGLMRRAFIDGTAPDFMQQVFEMEPGEIRTIGAGATVQVVRLDAVLEAEDTAEIQAFRDAAQTEANQALSNALFQAFMADAQSRANPQIDQQALNAVQASLATGGVGGQHGGN